MSTDLMTKQNKTITMNPFSVFRTRMFFSCVFLFMGLMLLGSQTVRGQISRFSIGYTAENYRYSVTSNQNYEAELPAVTKGKLQTEYTWFFHDFAYLSASGSYLLHNQQSLMGGPVDFRSINGTALFGLQWYKFGIYGGVRGGHMWDTRIRTEHTRGGRDRWVEPVGESSWWTSSYVGGVRYYFLRFFEFKAELTKSIGSPHTIEPSTGYFQEPAFESAQLNPYTLSFSVSISIPSYNKGSGADDRKLPPLMRGGTVNFSSPCQWGAVVTSPYGGRRNHEGIDIDTERGDPIRAAARGKVIKAGKGTGYGKMVKIQHKDGYVTIYAHLSRILVADGQQVRKGQRIGKAGNTGRSTGSHLHFELLKDGQPLNPERYIRF